MHVLIKAIVFTLCVQPILNTENRIKLILLLSLYTAKENLCNFAYYIITKYCYRFPMHKISICYFEDLYFLII